MSQENVELFRRSVDAFNRRDFDAWLVYLDPEITWYAMAHEPEPGPFQGHQGVLKMAGRWLDLLPDLRLDVQEYIDAGDYVIAPARVYGHATGSNAGVVGDEVFVDRFRDGKIVEVREYRTREEALEAVGLSEQDAHTNS